MFLEEEADIPYAAEKELGGRLVLGKAAAQRIGVLARLPVGDHGLAQGIAGQGERMHGEVEADHDPLGEVVDLAVFDDAIAAVPAVAVIGVIKAVGRRQVMTAVVFAAEVAIEANVLLGVHPCRLDHPGAEVVGQPAMDEKVLAPGIIEGPEFVTGRM